MYTPHVDFHSLLGMDFRKMHLTADPWILTSIITNVSVRFWSAF